MTVGDEAILNDLNQQTRTRLLDVAGEVFAEVGFKCATIREICRRAGANVAAVNYHFRGKEELYRECLSHLFASAVQKYPPTWGLAEHAGAQEKLHAYIRSFLYRILDQSRHAWYGKLIARNMVEPSPFLDECVNQSVRPMAERLRDIIREVVGPGLSDEQVKQAGLSITGQVVFHRHSRPVIEKLFPEMTYSHADLDALADHITKFSLAGLREMARQQSSSTQK